MAKRPTVPFTLHPSVRCVTNLEIPSACDLAIRPGGRELAVVHGAWGRREITAFDLDTSAPRPLFTTQEASDIESFTWSPDGTRWVATALRMTGDQRKGVVRLGHAEALATRVVITPTYCAVTRNQLARPADMAAYSPDGRTVVLRAVTMDDAGTLYTIDADDRTVHTVPIDPEGADAYAQAFTAAGALCVVSADPGDLGGLTRYDDLHRSASGRSPWVFGCAVVPTSKGVWALGASHLAFRVGEGGGDVVADDDALTARLDALEARARAAWDRSFLQWARTQMEGAFNFHLGRGSFSVSHPPSADPDARRFAVPLFWETSFAGASGDDLIVSDGVGVWRWHETAGGLTQTLLIDDVTRASPRGARIVGLTVEGATLVLLWRKDAAGTRTVASRFELA